MVSSCVSLSPSTMFRQQQSRSRCRHHAMTVVTTYFVVVAFIVGLSTLPPVESAGRYCAADLSQSRNFVNVAVDTSGERTIRFLRPLGWAVPVARRGIFGSFQPSVFPAIVRCLSYRTSNGNRFVREELPRRPTDRKSEARSDNTLPSRWTCRTQKSAAQSR